MIVVRWRWSSDAPRALRLETFLTKKSATRWMRFLCKPRPGEAHAVVVDAVGITVPKACKR